MSVITKIKSVLPSVSTVLTKGTGIAALGAVLYDSNYVGKMQADLYSSERDAKTTGYYLNNSMYLNSMSKIDEKIKDLSYTTELDQTYKRFFNEGIGYTKGFISMLIRNVIPLGLGLLATFGGKASSKAGAIGVAIYGAYRFIKHFFGMGTPPGMKFD